GVRKRWLRVLLILYPFATLFAIVVTANHYWLDAAGGALVLTIGYSIARVATPYLSARVAARQRETGQTDTASSMPLK
ncbi:MAG: phosphatase PAP2 family protein, partial [Actinobacteria bacterium]|nr:phosphatase PAP2 family protein [Actinomycetota bacterium]